MILSCLNLIYIRLNNKKMIEQLSTSSSTYLPKAPIYLIGEFHENEITQKGFSKIIHDHVEDKIFEVLKKIFDEKPESKLLFVNESISINSRNIKLSQRLRATGVSISQFATLQEFNYSPDPSSIYSETLKIYYATAINIICMIFDNYINQKTLISRLDYNEGAEFNTEYFENIVTGYGLKNVMTHRQIFIIDMLIKLMTKDTILESDIKLFNRFLNILINELIELIRPNCPEYIINNLSNLLDKTYSERKTIYNNNRSIFRMERDKRIINNIEDYHQDINFDLIIMYFGCDHFDNQKRLIQESTKLRMFEHEINMLEDINEITKQSPIGLRLIDTLVNKYPQNFIDMKNLSNY